MADIGIDFASARGSHVTTGFDISIERRGGTIALLVSGELDIATARLLEHELVLASRTSSSILLDLSAITFIDSAGLQIVVTARDMLRDRLSIRTSQACRRLLDISGLRELVAPEA